MRKQLIFVSILFFLVGAFSALSFSMILRKEPEQSSQARSTPPEIRATVQEFPAVSSQDMFAEDPKMGAQGKVKMRLEGKTIFWPEQYAPQSLRVLNLGAIPEAVDNSVIWEVSFNRRDALTLSRVEFGERIPFSGITYDPLYDPFQRAGKYAIIGVFYVKDDSSKTAEGTYGFEPRR